MFIMVSKDDNNFSIELADNAFHKMIACSTAKREIAHVNYDVVRFDNGIMVGD